MALIDRVKERTGADLSDTELQAMIDAITAEIEARFGTIAPITVMLGDPDRTERWRQTLMVARPIDEAQAITLTEIQPGNSGLIDSEVELDAADFRVLHGGRTLQRLTGGPNGATWWAPMVRATYTPKGNQAQRDEATIKLVALDLSYRGGLKSEHAGDYQFTLGADPVTERETILDSLAPRQGFNMA